jgi:hypothetical protein
MGVHSGEQFGHEPVLLRYAPDLHIFPPVQFMPEQAAPLVPLPTCTARSSRDFHPPCVPNCTQLLLVQAIALWWGLCEMEKHATTAACALWRTGASMVCVWERPSAPPVLSPANGTIATREQVRGPQYQPVQQEAHCCQVRAALCSLSVV